MRMWLVFALRVLVVFCNFSFYRMRNQLLARLSSRTIGCARVFFCGETASNVLTKCGEKGLGAFVLSTKCLQALANHPAPSDSAKTHFAHSNSFSVSTLSFTIAVWCQDSSELGRAMAKLQFFPVPKKSKPRAVLKWFVSFKIKQWKQVTCARAPDADLAIRMDRCRWQRSLAEVLHNAPTTVATMLCADGLLQKWGGRFCPRCCCGTLAPLVALKNRLARQSVDIDAVPRNATPTSTRIALTCSLWIMGALLPPPV